MISNKLQAEDFLHTLINMTSEEHGLIFGAARRATVSKADIDKALVTLSVLRLDIASAKVGKEERS